VIPWYTTVEVTIALLAGLFCVISGLARRTPNDFTIGAALLVEILLVVQLVIAIVAPFVGNRATGSVIEFYIYLVAAILIPLVGGFWALVERDRWSTVVLGVACLAVAVMMVRMNIIWTIQIA
jgi:hypothetical protein